MVRLTPVVGTLAALVAASSPSFVLSTPPPDMVEALSAYAAAGAVPTIPAGIERSRGLRRRTPEVAEEAENIVVLPPNGRPLKQLPDSFVRDARRHLREARSFLDSIEHAVGLDNDEDDKNKTAPATGAPAHAPPEARSFLDTIEHAFGFGEDKNATSSSVGAAAVQTGAPTPSPATNDTRSFLDKIEEKLGFGGDAATTTTAAPVAPTATLRMKRQARSFLDSVENALGLDDDKNSTSVAAPTATPRVEHQERSFLDSIEHAFGLGDDDSNKTASATDSAAVAAASASKSIDSHHYWYVEDSPDQAKWRSQASAAPSKRGIGSFFESLKDDFEATRTPGHEGDAIETAAPPASQTGFKKLRARAESSTIAPPDSSTVVPTPAPVATMHSAASAAAASASISQAVANLTWYDPTTWPSGISGEVQQEATSVKDKLNKMSMLSKIGLATLILVSTILLGFLIYCLCKLNIRRRRRSAAERVAAKMQQHPPQQPQQRPYYGGSATVPMASTGFNSRPTTPNPNATADKKGKRRMSWSARG